MDHRRWLPLILSSALLAGCPGPAPDPTTPFTPAPGTHLDLDRTRVAEFTIEFDRDGGTVVDVLAPDLDPAPLDELPELVLAARHRAPLDDVDLETLLAYLGPTGGTCTAADWGYEVRLTNNSAATWTSPLIQLTVIAPGATTVCNSDGTGIALPEGGASVADWLYGASLAATDSATAHWGFAPAGATSFTVRGWLTVIDDTPTCGGLPPGNPGVCSGHGSCIAEDYCDCDAGWQRQPGAPQNCEDIDECAAGTHDCHEIREVCANTQGSFDCDCAAGWAEPNCSDCAEHYYPPQGCLERIAWVDPYFDNIVYFIIPWEVSTEYLTGTSPSYPIDCYTLFQNYQGFFGDDPYPTCRFVELYGTGVTTYVEVSITDMTAPVLCSGDDFALPAYFITDPAHYMVLMFPGQNLFPCQ